MLNVTAYDHLIAFSSGTVIGATFMYTILKFIVSPVPKNSWTPSMEGEFEYGKPDDEYRLIMGVRGDVKMQKGKVAAQCGHAAVAAYSKALKECPHVLEEWLKYGGTKIAVRVSSEEILLDLEKKARQMNVLASIVRDAGHTQVAPGTRTVIALGPARKSILNQIAGHLKLY